jgi:hypothetical protein
VTPQADPWTAAMLDGDFPKAWAVNDAVLRQRDPATRDDPSLPYHLRHVWDGRAPDGRDVLVRCYHGLGDTLQFCRFLPALRRRAARVTLEVQAELAVLLRDMADAVVPFDVAAPLPPAGCDLEIMELAHALRLPPDAAPPPYLTVRPATLQDAIGVCWAAGDWNRSRSLPLSSLLDVLPKHRPLISLQRGTAAAQAVSRRFLDPCDDDPDVARTAALVAGCRCVVTVDTMVAHLAGALGRPATVLLKHDADWRWMRGERTAWYPTLRLLRQEVPGDWSGPLRALLKAAG